MLSGSTAFAYRLVVGVSLALGGFVAMLDGLANFHAPDAEYQLIVGPIFLLFGIGILVDMFRRHQPSGQRYSEAFTFFLFLGLFMMLAGILWIFSSPDFHAPGSARQFLFASLFLILGTGIFVATVRRYKPKLDPEQAALLALAEKQMKESPKPVRPKLFAKQPLPALDEEGEKRRQRASEQIEAYSQRMLRGESRLAEGLREIDQKTSNPAK